MEKRSHKRHPIRATINGHDNPVAVFDLSQSGVRLVGDFRPDQEDIELCLQVGGAFTECRGRVAWWKAFGPSGVYQVGVSFTEVDGIALTQELDSLGTGQLVSEDRGALLNLSEEDLSRLSLLARISHILNASTDIDDLLSRVMDIAMQTMGAERGLLLMEQDGDFQPTIIRGAGVPSFSHRVVDHVRTTGEPLVSIDAVDDQRLRDSQSLEMLGTRSVLCVPIRTCQHSLGLIYLDNSMTVGVFRNPELHLVMILADMAAAALDRAEYLGFVAKSQAQLAAARDDLHNLVEKNPDGILILNQGGFVGFCNPAAEHLLGDKLLGKQPSFSVNTHELLELPITRADNSPGRGQLRAEETQWGNEPATLVTITDVTIVKEKEEQLRHSQKMQAVGRLAGGIAHDFNNLLTAILGYCDILQLGDNNPENITQIRSAAERAASLTEQLLTFSRRRVRRPAVLELNSLVTTLQRMLGPLLGEDVRTQLTLDDSDLMISADRDEVEQVLMNLAINAREAMPTGGDLKIETGIGRPKQETRVTPNLGSGPFVYLRVSDTGHGMEEDVQDRVFEPFYTTKALGTGLGMATVYGIVEACGGGVTLTSEPKVGSQFTIYFPQVHEALADKPRKKPQVVPVGSERVLLVEDEPSVRNVTVKMLKRVGYQVVDVGSSEEALELGLKLAEFDLLVSDIMLPGMNGLELARQLHERYKELRILLVSGYSEDVIDARTGSGSDFPFLHKPFTISGLTEKVRDVLSDCVES